MFWADDEATYVVTDTMATSGELVPSKFQSKCWPMPYMNMAIAVTGDAELGYRWLNHVQRWILAPDLVILDRYVTDALMTLTAELVADNGGEPRGSTCTIYHFGIPEGETRPVRYVYRSTNGFKSERFQDYGFGVKPGPESFGLEQPTDLDGWIDLAQRIKDEQYDGSASEPVGIGGELYLTQVGNHFVNTLRIHRFDDYEKDWRTMMLPFEQN
jgi:hypothetical protein